MRIFKLTLFLGLCILCAVLDFLFIETSPFVVRAALSAAAIAAIAGGSALIGGVGNLLSSADTNEANKEINRENREWQTQENEKNRNWSQKMWEAENVYNTPSAQMARMKSAGLNPYLVQGQGASAGNAGSPTSPAAQSAPSSIPQQRPDFGFIGDAGANAVDAYNSVRSVDANVANQISKTDSEVISNAESIYKLTGNKKAAESYMNNNLKSAHGINYSMDNSPLARSYQARVVKDEADADYARSVADLKASYGDKEMRVALRLQSLEGDKLKEEMLNLAKDREKSDVEIKRIISERIRNYAEAKHLNADTKSIDATRDLILEGLKYDNRLKYANASIRENERAESDTLFVQRSDAREWQRSSSGKNEALHHQVTLDNEALTRLEKIIHGSQGLYK